MATFPLLFSKPDDPQQAEELAATFKIQRSENLSKC
jgi:hypothetical protein